MKLCRCGNFDLTHAPHTVNGNPGEVSYQVMGAPQFGREAHTARECFREVPATEAWTLAHKEWVASLDTPDPLPCPMPVGHIMFDAMPGSAALSRKDNAARAAVQS